MRNVRHDDLPTCVVPVGKTNRVLVSVPYKIRGTATFYEGLKLPADFEVTRKEPTGDLPTTKKDPGKLPGAMGSKEHDMTVEWNCCPAGHTEKSKISHN
jgi:hypothetical protein